MIFRRSSEGEVLKGPKTLFFIQIFSTLAFSVLYSTLILYMTKGLRINDDLSSSTTASFIAFNYTLHLLGGYFGGRLLAYRELFILGMFWQIIGCLLIAVPETNFLYWGLAFFLSGTGLNVTCINCMVTQLFHAHDKRRESVFLWNYSGMNIGFLIGFTISGYFQLNEGYTPLFILSACGNVIAALVALFNWKVLRDRDTHFSNRSQSSRWKFRLIGLGCIIVLILALRWLLQHASFSNDLIMIVGAIMVFVIAALAMRQTEIEWKKKLWAYLILALASFIFWTLYQMAPMALTLFIQRNVNRMIFGHPIPPQWFGNINTIIIIIGGPLMASGYTWLRKKGVNVNIPVQFTIALFLIGIGYVLLPFGIDMADRHGLSSPTWVILCYVFQSLGELFTSPIGYAMIGQLVPTKLQGVLMGTWLMITGVAATLSNVFSKTALGATHLTNPLDTSASFSHTFNILGWGSIAGGVILIFLIRFLHRLIQEKYAEKSMEAHPYNAPEDTPSDFEE